MLVERTVVSGLDGDAASGLQIVTGVHVRELDDREETGMSVPNPSLISESGDGQCCYYCASAIGELCKDEDALIQDWAPCSEVQLGAARSQILRNLELWKEEKSAFYSSVKEFEEAEELTYLQDTWQVFIDRLMGTFKKKIRS